MTFGRYGNVHFAPPSVFDFDSAQLVDRSGPELPIRLGDSVTNIDSGSQRLWPIWA